MIRDSIPEDWPVQPVSASVVQALPGLRTWAQCGTCGRWWDDGTPTSMTPAPSARCPFEPFHDDPTTLAEIVAEYGYGPQHPEEIEEQEGDYVLVERSVYDRAHYYTAHESRGAASDYIAGQEYPEDWAPQALVHLPTGQRFYPELRVLWHRRPAQ